MRFPDTRTREIEAIRAGALRAGAGRLKVGEIRGNYGVDHGVPTAQRDLTLSGGWALRCLFGAGGHGDMAELSIGPELEPHWARRVAFSADLLPELARLLERVAERDPELPVWTPAPLEGLYLSGIGSGPVVGDEVPIGRSWVVRIVSARTGRCWISTGPVGDLHATMAIPFPADQLEELAGFVWEIVEEREWRVERRGLRALDREVVPT